VALLLKCTFSFNYFPFILQSVQQSQMIYFTIVYTISIPNCDCYSISVFCKSVIMLDIGIVLIIKF